MSDPFEALLAQPVAGNKPATADPFEALLAQPSAAPSASSSLARNAKAFGQGALSTVADAVDLAYDFLSAPLGAGAMAGSLLTRGVSELEGRTPRDRKASAAQALEAADAVSSTIGQPVRKALQALGLLPEEPGLIGKSMSRAMEIAGQAAANIETNTDGAVKKEEVLMGVNALFAALGVKGAKAIETSAVARGKAKAGLEELAKLKAEGDARNAAADAAVLAKEVAGTPAESAVAAPTAPPTPPALLPRNERIAAIKAKQFVGDSLTPEEATLLGQEVVKTRLPTPVELNLAGVAERPQPMPDGSIFGSAEALSTRNALEGRGLANTLATGEAGKLTASVPTLDSALAKTRAGRLFDLTPEERIAIKGLGRKAIDDPKILTAAVVGATGLGLAMAYEPDKTETALAVGVGALLLGRGKGISLEDIHALPEGTTLRPLRDASATTLNTIEHLPGNQPVLRKQAISELLRRPEVTKAERDILQGVMDAHPGETITPKQLMAGVKERTGDFELKPRKTDDFADYGLQGIDRKVADEWIPEDLSPAETARLEAEAAADKQALQATTTIWRSPIKLGSNNHFRDPNYFAHTRSFYEGAIKHVVELQSDLAQKAGKVLGAEERARLREEHAQTQARIEAALDPSNPARREPATMAAVRADRLLQAEINAKLLESNSLEPISPMLKRWDKRLIREELADSARAGQPVVRFATADTVAKVEGWPRENLRIRDIPDDQMTEADWLSRGDGPLSPEHQGIYDRYAKETTTFLKQLGGREVTDSAGHTWIEVPTEGSKRTPAGKRVQQFGLSQPELLAAMATLGIGAVAGKALEQYLFDDDSKGKTGATLGFVLSGLAMLAMSKHGGLSDFASAVARKADYSLGMLSTRIGDISQPLLRRMTQFEFGALKRAHESGLAIAPFVEAWRGLKNTPQKAALAAALLTNVPTKIFPALGTAGSPALVAGYRAARAELDKIGVDLKQYGLLKDLRADYFTRMVKDYPGLRKALGAELGTRLDERLKKAEEHSVATTGAPLSPIEVSNITNKFLAESGTASLQRKAGFLRKRVIGEVTEGLLPYYFSPDEGLILYVRSAANAIEKAKLFKDFAERDPVTGKMNLEASIGNLVAAERAAGRVSADQVIELQSMLRSRFGPGEHAMAGWLQDVRNTTNLFLLGNPFAGVAQLGDLATNVAANRLLPSVKAGAQLAGSPALRVTLRDMGIVNHIAEELSGTRPTARLLNSALKTGLSPVDSLGKVNFLNGKLNDFRQQATTKAGLANLTRRYADYMGPQDFAQLVSDLRSGQRTPLVDEVLFRELSNFQPITKLESTQFGLDNPNARILYMLRSFQLKQIDILRREAWKDIRSGEASRVARGTGNLLRFGMALGISGAGTAVITDFLNGKDVDLRASDVLLNATKVFGLSQYTLDRLAQGQRLEALGSLVLPPWRVWDQIVTADPTAVRYIPLVGPYLYWHHTEAGQRQIDREAERKARADK